MTRRNSIAGTPHTHLERPRLREAGALSLPRGASSTRNYGPFSKHSVRKILATLQFQARQAVPFVANATVDLAAIGVKASRTTRGLSEEKA